ncbi:MAG: hypothetical protein B7733_13985 [Myxococcales bacterium FL481]|nr:MAG: hypothetical protein B7733_13985 [Myxococcales bacterium FL481]
MTNLPTGSFPSISTFARITTAVVFAAGLSACGSESSTETDTDLRAVDSAASDLESQYDEATECADSFGACADHGERCEASLEQCLPDRPADLGHGHDGNVGHKRPRPGPFARPAIRECLPDLRTCIEDGGDKKECVAAFKVCVREYIEENFEEICEDLLARCDEADPRPPRCDRIEKRCEEGLDFD